MLVTAAALPESFTSAWSTLVAFAMFFWTHPGLTVLLAIVVFSQYRAHANAKLTGVPVEPPFKSWTPAWNEVKTMVTPVSERAPAWMTTSAVAYTMATLAVVLLLGAPFVGARWWDLLGVVFLVAFVQFVKRTYAPIAAQREAVRLRILDKAAAAGLKVPAIARLEPDKVVEVESWERGWVPSKVTLTYDAAQKLTDARPQFEQQCDGIIPGVSWDYQWPDNSGVQVTFSPSTPVPDKVALSALTPAQFAWHEMPLGKGRAGRTMTWDVRKAPHLLATGSTGRGKSATMRNVILHAIASGRWEMVLNDPKQMDLAPYKDAPNVARYAVTPDEILDALTFARDEMTRRNELISASGVQKLEQLPNSPAYLLVVVEEALYLLSETKVKDVDAKKQQMRAIILELVSLGRAAGVHVLLAAQRPDAAILGGAVRFNFPGRVGMGYMDSSSSQMMFGDSVASMLPREHPGRGVMATNEDYQVFQGFHMPDDDFAAAIDLCVFIGEALQTGRVTQAHLDALEVLGENFWVEAPVADAALMVKTLFDPQRPKNVERLADLPELMELIAGSDAATTAAVVTKLTRSGMTMAALRAKLETSPAPAAAGSATETPLDQLKAVLARVRGLVATVKARLPRTPVKAPVSVPTGGAGTASSVPTVPGSPAVLPTLPVGGVKPPLPTLPVTSPSQPAPSGQQARVGELWDDEEWPEDWV